MAYIPALYHKWQSQNNPVAIKGDIKICASGMRCPNEAAFCKEQNNGMLLSAKPNRYITRRIHNGVVFEIWKDDYTYKCNALLFLLHYSWHSLLVVQYSSVCLMASYIPIICQQNPNS